MKNTDNIGLKILKKIWDAYRVIKKNLLFPFKYNRFYFQKKHIVSAKKIDDLLRLIKPVNIQDQLIRVGSKFDGGYVLPNKFENISACFSPGVGQKNDFDIEIADKGIEVFMCDASVEELPEKHPKINFEKKFLGSKNTEKEINVNDWINSKNISGDLLLEMDIEGAEYECIETISRENLNRFKIMVIEFHFLDNWWLKNSYDKYLKILEKLNKNHQVVHLHPNTACGFFKVNKKFKSPLVLEITYMRKDSIENIESKENISLPHNEDNFNIKPVLFDLQNQSQLPTYWYK